MYPCTLSSVAFTVLLCSDAGQTVGTVIWPMHVYPGPLPSVALTVQAVRLSAALCLDYKLHDRQQWAQLLQQMITLHMVSSRLSVSLWLIKTQ